MAMLTRVGLIATWLVGVASVDPLCDSTTQYICNGSPIPFGGANTSGQGCAKCNTGGEVCGGANPQTNLTCFRTTKSCQVCGPVSKADLDVYTSNGYTLSFQPFCNVDTVCSETLLLNRTIRFTRQSVVVEKGNVGVGSLAKISARCPAFVFDGTEDVKILGLEIECFANSFESTTAPAIVFQKSPAYTIVVRSLVIYGRFLSGLLVYGGNTDITPPLSVSSLTGQIDGLNATGSTLVNQLSSVFSAASFYCSEPLPISDLAEHSRIVVQPHVGPTGTTSDFEVTGRGNLTYSLVNLSTYLDEFGAVYETQFYDEGAYSALDTDAATFSKEVMLYQVAIAVALFGSLFVLHQDTLYYFSVRNAITS